MIFDHTTKYNVLFACILSFSAELHNLYPKISTQKNEHYMELYIGKYARLSYNNIEYLLSNVHSANDNLKRRTCSQHNEQCVS